MYIVVLVRNCGARGSIAIVLSLIIRANNTFKIYVLSAMHLTNVAVLSQFSIFPQEKEIGKD